jgi:sporulation protein YlmC with PRC-barrel domain
MSTVTVSSNTVYIIGSAVTGSDGVCGELRRIIVDPAAQMITHLVVEPRHRYGEGHLVPIILVDSTANTIQLRCTTTEFKGLEDAEDTHFLLEPGQAGYTEDQKRSIPAYSGMAGGGGMAGLGPAPAMGGMGVGGMGAMGRGAVRQASVTEDQVPAGEIELCSDQPVHATDGAIGRVQGLAVDPSDHHVTHVLLDEGHLWGKKRVAVPFSAVTSVDNGVRLNLAKDQVRDLPAIDVPDWA